MLVLIESINFIFLIDIFHYVISSAYWKRQYANEIFNPFLKNEKHVKTQHICNDDEHVRSTLTHISYIVLSWCRIWKKKTTLGHQTHRKYSPKGTRNLERRLSWKNVLKLEYNVNDCHLGYWSCKWAPPCWCAHISWVEPAKVHPQSSFPL